jgi:hypothetical protein
MPLYKPESARHGLFLLEDEATVQIEWIPLPGGVDVDLQSVLVRQIAAVPHHQIACALAFVVGDGLYEFEDWVHKEGKKAKRKVGGREES